MADQLKVISLFGGSNDQYTYTYAACVLDFSSFPYQPTGECIGVKEKMKVWDSFSTTLCCRNALTALSQALAEQARDGKGNIFIDEAEWRHCSGFFQPQQSVSVQSCGFVDLFNGSTECSSVSLTSIREEQSYKDASRKCSQFSTSTSSSFDDTCRDCSRAVVEARDRLLDKLNVKKNGREKAICGVAVVISIAASREFDDHNNSLVDDFYSCLQLMLISIHKYPPDT